MTDVPLAPVESTQVIQNRLLDPYLKENISIGLVSSTVINLPPVKETASSDKVFVFQFPQIPNHVDLKNVQLYLKGSIRKNSKNEKLNYDKSDPAETQTAI